MPKAYLTIDDSPSLRTDDLVDYLTEYNIPALLFCRGDLLEKNPVAIIRAIQNGLVIGNHGYHHIRASDLSYEEIIDGIQRTENLIDNLYDMANVEKTGQYFRFPHMDRGCGSQVIDFNQFEDVKTRTQVQAIFTEGLNIISNKKPTSEQIEKRDRLQTYLKENGYTTPFLQTNIDWYAQSKEIQNASDCFFTYSSSDWMLTQRHLGKWRYQSYDDLSEKIASDHWLLKTDSASIILMHDQTEIIETVFMLLNYLRRCEMEFLEFDT